MRRRVLEVGLGLATAVILAICLPPASGVAGVIQTCVFCGYAPLSNLVLNMLLYVPFGFVVRARWGSLTTAVLAGLALSASVEFVQLWIPGRFTSMADLFANGAGAALGAWVAGQLALWLRPAPEEATALSRGWAVSAGVLIIGSCVALTPVLPAGTLFVGLTPDLGRHARYPAPVTAASIGPVPLTSPSRLSDEGRSLLDEGGPVALDFPFHQQGELLAPLIQITAGERGEALLLGVRRDDIVVRRRLLATTLGMATPEIVFPRALEGFGTAEPVEVVFETERLDGYVVAIEGQPEARQGLTSVRIWSLWYQPGDAPEWFGVLLDIFWIAGLLIPVGFWAVSVRSAVGAASIPVGALWLAPFKTAAIGPPFVYLIFAVAALALGHATSRRLIVRRGADE